MDSLPPELYGNICRHLESNIDLKALSLLNRQWAAAARPHLFRRIHVIPWPSCLTRLEQSLQQPLVRTHAKELHLHLPSMPTFESTFDGEKRLRADIGSSFTGKEPWFRGDQTKDGGSGTDSGEPTEKEWTNLFFYHQGHVGQYAHSISQLMNGAIWKALKDAIGRPLERFALVADDIWTGYAEVWCLLQSNYRAPARADNRFGMLAGSMIEAGLLDDVKELDLQRLAPETLSAACPTFQKVPTKLVESADRVYLSYAPPNFPEEQTAGTNGSREYRRDFMGSATLPDHTKETLEELSVQWYNESSDGVALSADIPLGPAYDCTTLRRLSLGGLTLTFGIVQGMLDNVRETLECLELRDIQMVVYGDTVPNGDTTPRGFFCALVENHRLKEAEFKEWFGMDDNGYNMNAGIGEYGFELCREDEKAILGQEVARAVVLEPAHRCVWEADRAAERRDPPSKDERLKWLRETFHKIDERVAKRKAERLAEQRKEREGEGKDDEDEWEDEEGDEEGEWEDEDDDEEDEETGHET